VKLASRAFSKSSRYDRTAGGGLTMTPGSSLPDELVLLQECLATVSDPRHARGIRHPLLAVLSLTVLARMAGQRSLSAIGRWGGLQPELLRALGLRGSPSVATLSRLLRAVSVVQVREALRNFTRQLHPQRTPAETAAERPLSEPEPGTVAAAGKTMRAAWEDGRQQHILHLFATHSRVA